MRNINQPWLLIFDDISTREEIEDIVKNRGDSREGHLIFTSKYDLAKKNYIKIGKLNRLNSIKLLRHFLDKYGEEYFDRLADALEDHPLALVTAAFYIRQVPSLTIAAYISLFKKNSLVLTRLESQGIILLRNNDYCGSFASVMHLMLEEVKKKSIYAYEFLLFIAFIDSRNIRNDLIVDWLRFNALDEDLLHEIIYVLSSHFLIEKTRQDDSAAYQIHELLQETIRTLIPKKEQDIILGKAKNFFLTYFQQDTFQVSEILKNKPYIFFHAKRVYELLPVKSSKDLEFLIHFCHAALFYQGDMKTGKNLITEIADLIDRENVKLEGFVEARYLNTKGKTLYVEDLGLAINLTKKAIDILRSDCEHDFRVNSELFLAVVNNLVDYYLIQGRVHDAKESCYSYRESLKKLHNHVYETVYYSFLALCEMYEGEYEKAIKSIDLSYKSIQDGGLSESQFIFVLVNKAEILARMDKFIEALALVLKLKKDLQNIFQGENTHLVIRNKIIESYISYKLGNKDFAEKAIKESIREYEKLVNSASKDPLQGFAHTVLGEIYFDSEKYDEAINELQIADKIYDDILIVREFDDLSYLYQKIIFASIKDQQTDLIRYYFKKHLENFGLTHKRMPTIVSYFDERSLPVPW